jgi:outer membrane protein TolC
MIRSASSIVVLLACSLISITSKAQDEQPPPFTAPNPAISPALNSPGQQPEPTQQRPQVTPDAPLPQSDKTTVDQRDLPALTTEPRSSKEPSATVKAAENTDARPKKESPSPLNTGFFSLIAPYHAPRVPDLPLSSTSRLNALIRDGKLYLSLHDAIELTVENNMDVEVSRYNLLLADADVTRAKGGGNLRGIDFTIQQTPSGIAEATIPLLITASGNGAATNATVTDLSQVMQIGSTTPQSLAVYGTSTYSAGPPIPLYDPTLAGEAGFLRRSDAVSLDTTSGSSSGSMGAQMPPLDFVSTGLDFQQGFSTGAQLEAYVDNSAQVLYGANSQYNPFHSPSTSITLTQPLLRGFGRGVNLRFIRIAQLDRKVSRLIFEQQLLETVYGISRLYYDLVALGENIGVKEESLAAAQRLLADDKNQVDEGTLAPVELTRAQALLSSSRLDLIQARGEYRQQEVILRGQILRSLGDPASNFTSIIPTDKIVVPDDPPALDISALTQDALVQRPDLAQAALQVKADEIAAKAARNNVRPLLNLYANIETRGSSIVPYEPLGSPGTGIATAPLELTQGGLRLSTIYQAGLQLNMPLRNRIAQSDAVRDAIQLRQAQGRTVKMENDVRQQVENAAIALEVAHQAYAASVESSNYQQQLLQAEIDKLAVGASTHFMVVQDQAYLAQSRSTEVAARSDWMKAKLSLDHVLGDLLEKNNVLLEDAIGH